MRTPAHGRRRPARPGIGRVVRTPRHRRTARLRTGGTGRCSGGSRIHAPAFRLARRRRAAARSRTRARDASRPGSARRWRAPPGRRRDRRGRPPATRGPGPTRRAPWRGRGRPAPRPGLRADRRAAPVRRDPRPSPPRSRRWDSAASGSCRISSACAVRRCRRTATSDVSAVSSARERLDGSRSVARGHAQLSDPLPQLGGQLRLGGMSSTHLLVQPLCLQAGLDSEPRRQKLAQPLVPAESLAALPCERMQTDQEHVAFLPLRLDVDEPARHAHCGLDLAACLEEACQLFEQGDEVGLELVAVRARPLLVAVLRKQAVAIELQCFRVRRRIAASARVRNCSPPRVDVDPEPVARQSQRFPHRGDQPRALLRVDGAPRVMNCLPQVGSGRGRLEPRPEDVHRLLAVQPVTRRQRQQLDDARRLAPAPRRRRNRALPHRDPKAAEQLDPNRRRICHARTILRSNRDALAASTRAALRACACAARHG